MRSTVTRLRSLGHRAPLLWLVLPLMVGITLGRLTGVSAMVSLGLAVGTIGVASVALWRQHRAAMAALTLGVLFAGAATYALHRARLADWDDLPAREIDLSLRVQRVFPRAEGKSTAGLAVITAAPSAPELVGQRVYFSMRLPRGGTPPIRSTEVRARGVLMPLPDFPPVDTFDRYLADAGVNFRFARGQLLATEKPATAYHQFLERAAARLNVWLGAGIGTKRPELTAVFRAMMLGQKHELSDEQQTEFMHSGTMHLFAINGLHIGVVALSIHALLTLARCPRPLAAVVTLAVLWFDVDTTGATPSAVRAFLLVACFEAAYVLRRPGDGLAALSAAAFIVLLIDPMALFSASFQMSYGVVLVILCFGLPLAEALGQHCAPFQDLPRATWTRRHRLWEAALRWLWPMVGLGVSAALVSAVTGPAFFHTFTPFALLTNLALVPVAGLVIVAGFASVVASAIGASAIGLLFNHAALVLLVAIDATIRASVRLPATWWAAQWRVSWAAPVALAALIAVVLAGYAMRWRAERGGWWPPFAVVTLALVFGVKFG